MKKVILTSLFTAIFAASVMAMPKSVVIVKPVSKRMVQNQQKVIGTLRAFAEANLAARENGAVEEVYFNEGDKVRKGQVIVKLDQRRLEAQLKELEARKSTANAVIEQRQAEYDRALTDFEMKDKLFKEDAIAQRELLDARREMKVSQAQLQSAKDTIVEIDSQIDLLQIRLEDMEVKAPFDAWLTERHVEESEWLTVGTPIVTLVAADKIEAWLNIPERYISTVQDYLKEMNITIDATNQSVASREIKIIPDIDQRSRMFQIVVELDNKNSNFSPGMSVTSWVPESAKSEQIVVPKDAVVQNNFGSHVFKINETEQGTIAQQTPVKVLFSTATETMIQSPMLKPKDLVIVEGNERLFPNTPVEVVRKGGSVR